MDMGGLQALVGDALRQVEGVYSRIWLLDECMVELTCAAAEGVGAHGAAGSHLRLDSVAGQVAVGGAPLVLADVRGHVGWLADPRLFDARPDAGAYLCVPVVQAGVPLGAIEVIRETSRPFGAHDERALVQLANAAAGIVRGQEATRSTIA